MRKADSKVLRRFEKQVEEREEWIKNIARFRVN